MRKARRRSRREIYINLMFFFLAESKYNFNLFKSIFRTRGEREMVTLWCCAGVDGRRFVECGGTSTAANRHHRKNSEMC